jgi:hypothetical protein
MALIYEPIGIYPRLRRFVIWLILVIGMVLYQTLTAHVHSPAPLPDPPVTASRPSFSFTTQEKFDSAAIPAYRGDHPKGYAYIDAHLSQHLENLRRWVRQPSVSDMGNCGYRSRLRGGRGVT